jgi:restriction endonuclease S subunit
MSNTYTISNPALNLKRVFILQKSEVEKRYDPSWYVYLQSIHGFKHKKVAFKSLLFNNPQYGANEIGINRESNKSQDINEDALKSIIVVVPPLNKQKEIADHVTNIRNQAQALKDKTKDLLKNASEEILLN